MRISYDREADALSVHLATGRSVETIGLGPGINADLDAGGRLLSLEVLRASEAYPPAELAALGEAPVRWLTLAEAAHESGLAAATLRVQLNAGKIPGQKRGRDWVIAEPQLWDYLENRKPTGRKPTSRKGRALRRKVTK